MTSVGPSPPKRIKLPGGPPPASKIPLLRPQSQSNNNNPSSTAAAAAKHPAPPQQVFSTAASSALRFRRIGSPRLSQSPVRKQPPPPQPQQQPATPSFFHDSDVGSSVARLGGTPADTPRAGTGTGTGTPTPTPTPTPTSTSTPTPTPRRPVLAERAGNEKRPRDEDTPPLPPAKEKTPPHHHHHQQDENATEDRGEDALRRLLAERVAALRAEIEALKDQRELEEARIAREAAAAAVVKRGGRDKDKDKDKDKERTDDGLLLQALVQRLLSANDGSHTTLPALRTVHTSKAGEEEQQQEQELIPSARPRPSTDPGAFHCLTFTRASTTTTTDPAAAAPLQQHTAAGYASARLLAFTLTFTLDAATARIHSLAATVSAWARAELRAPLAAAAADGDVSRALYALSSYTVMARRRAGVFARCARCFPDLLPGVVGGGGGKGRREVVAWLGRSVVVFRRRGGEEGEREREGRGGRAGVELVVGWRIGVDGMGEAESELSADVRFPGCWKDADDRGSLRKVGEVFAALVADRGVFEAVRCVAGLVFQ